MTNRREFLQTGVSVSALPLVMRGLLAPGTAAARGTGERLVLHKAIVDDRYAEGRQFAETLGEIGVPAEALNDGDVTRAYLALDALWRNRPVAIAGLTQFGPMLVLERLGGERGLRMAFRAEHRVSPDGMLAHALSGAPETLDIAENLRREVLDWPVLIAALAANCRGDCLTPAERIIATPGRKPAMTRAAPASSVAGEPESVIHYYRPFTVQEGREIPWDGPLFSWVIAPAARA